MHETDTPDPVTPESADGATEVSDDAAVLDEFEADLDNVASALDALDAEDLDGAEALVTGLGDSAAPDEPDAAEQPH